MSLLDEPFSLNVGATDLQLGHFTYQFLLLLLFFFFFGGGGLQNYTFTLKLQTQ